MLKKLRLLVLEITTSKCSLQWCGKAQTSLDSTVKVSIFSFSARFYPNIVKNTLKHFENSPDKPLLILFAPECKKVFKIRDQIRRNKAWWCLSGDNFRARVKVAVLLYSQL